MSRKNTRMVEEAILIVLIVATMTTCISEKPENENSTPHIAADEEGNTYLTWMGRRLLCDRSSDVYWVKIDAEGVRGPIQKVSTHPNNLKYDEWGPHIAIDYQKNSCIVWNGSDGSYPGIYWGRIDAEGIPSETSKISAHPDDVGEFESDVRTAADGQGNFYVVWDASYRSNVGGTLSSNICWARVDAEGIPGEVIEISAHPDDEEYSDHSPQIAVDVSGNSYIIWSGYGDEDWSGHLVVLEIYWVKIDAEGVPGAIQKISARPDDAHCQDFNPRMAIDAEGNSYVVWKEKVLDSGGTVWMNEIYWVKIDAEGVQGAIQRISAYPDDADRFEFDPRIAVDAEGNSCIAWGSLIEKDSDPKDYEIHWVRISAEGILGEISTISLHPDKPGEKIQDLEIVVDEQGNSGVVWSSHRGRDIEIYWVKIDEEGVQSEISRLSTYPDSSSFDDVEPQIAVDREGNFYVTWYTVQWYADEGISHDVYWVRIDAEGVPGELQKISAGDLPCESPLENETNVINLFISAFLAYWIYIFVSAKGGIHIE